MKKIYLTIIAIICILIISGMIVLVLLSNKDVTQVSSDETQNIQNLIINELDLQQNFILENMIEENTIQENIVEVSKNVPSKKTQEANKKENTTKKSSTTNSKPYYIKVNYGAQVVTIYKKDNSGNYTVPVKAMICSTGEYTPKSGTYSIPARWKWLGLQGGVAGQYCTQITGNILFHSVPYLTKGDPGSLEYWEYDKLGTYASAGCIRLTVQDAKWIYDNCAKGTKVEFYSSSNPGPLGKPTAKKISDAEGELKNWDPTDPNPNNPWKNYKQQTNTTNKNKVTNTQTNTTNQNKVTNTQTNTTSQNKVTNTQTNTTSQNKVTNTQTNTTSQNKVNITKK